MKKFLSFALLFCTFSQTVVLAKTQKKSKDLPGWSYLYQKDGITVYKEEKEKNSYRADGVISENFFEVLAVAADIKRRSEWVPNLRSSRIVSGDLENQVTLYEEFDLPWPAKDRDVVLGCKIQKNYVKKNLLIQFENITIKDVPPLKGKIRVPIAKGEMEFSFLDETRTKARYQIKLDPGGALPGFIVSFFVKKAPLKALKGLMKQIGKTKGDYKEFIEKHQKISQDLLPSKPLPGKPH